MLCVPNWSLVLDAALAAEARGVLSDLGLTVHDVSSDFDHGRTVTAFSGRRVAAGVAALADLFLPRIDLSGHVGAHPRTGALDVCPLVDADDREVVTIGRDLLARGIPYDLYEESNPGTTLPALRKLAQKGHARWGRTVLGRRRFLIAANLNLKDMETARDLAQKIRAGREAGDPPFVGVRALAFELPSMGLAQLSLNLTRPDVAGFDGVARWTMEWAEVLGTELVGVIRWEDLTRATLLNVRAEQVYLANG